MSSKPFTTAPQDVTMASEAPVKWAKESGHWYDSVTGEPRYTIVGKNGQERATTVRDARKHNYVPSVTTVLNCAAKWGLERWKAEQLLMAGLTLPKQDGETETAWIGRVWDDSKQQAIKAAERGTAIHAAVESFYRDGRYLDEFTPWVNAVEKCVMECFGNPDWSAEKSFANPLGYGGKGDLHSNGAVLDFKTKDGDLGGVKLWDDHFMQLAAYSVGLGRATATCGIVFISRTEPKATACILSADEQDRGWRMFSALLDYWKAANL